MKKTKVFSLALTALVAVGLVAQAAIPAVKYDRIKAIGSTLTLTATSVVFSAALAVTTSITAATGVITSSALVGGAAISGQAGPFQVVSPVAQTIGSGGTIAADACGGVKRITAIGTYTTDTTDSFTAPAAANKDCYMNVINVSTNTITIDDNAHFFATGANIALGAGDTVRVVSSGAAGAWYQIGTTGNN